MDCYIPASKGFWALLYSWRSEFDLGTSSNVDVVSSNWFKTCHSTLSNSRVVGGLFFALLAWYMEQITDDLCLTGTACVIFFLFLLNDFNQYDFLSNRYLVNHLTVYIVSTALIWAAVLAVESMSVRRTASILLANEWCMAESGCCSVTTDRFRLSPTAYMHTYHGILLEYVMMFEAGAFVMLLVVALCRTTITG